LGKERKKRKKKKEMGIPFPSHLLFPPLCADRKTWEKKKKKKKKKVNWLTFHFRKKKKAEGGEKG